jgi:hypothetical protein
LCFVQPRSGQGVSQVCWSAGAGCFGIKHGWFHWESWVFSWHWYGWMMFLDDINDRRMDGDIMIYMGIWMILMILMIYIYWYMISWNRQSHDLHPIPWHVLSDGQVLSSGTIKAKALLWRSILGIPGMGR